MTILDAAWVHAPASRAVMAALGDGYFVGGCVRNALLGAPVADIDIATPLRPEQARDRLTARGIKTIPTGLSHGTITAVVDGDPIEVTSFRTDSETDGRHARVTFTTDMRADASRRDFTVNALYAAADGTLIDPLGGLDDLRTRSIRFIGRPEDRIREDYLRILRFFRFHAWYGRADIDADGLAACASLAEGIDGLARERVGWEIRKLLSAPDPAPAVASMAATGILARCLPGADPVALAPMIHIEGQHALDPDWRARLMVMGTGDWADALRLSRAEIAFMAATRAALASGDAPALQAYRLGVGPARTAALIRAASIGGDLPAGLEPELARGESLSLPISARDLLAAGFSPGPDLGALMGLLEARWVESDFSLDRAGLLDLAGDPGDQT